MGFATGDEERGSNETLFNCTGRTEIWYGPCAAVCRWIGMSLSKQSGSSLASLMRKCPIVLVLDRMVVRHGQFYPSPGCEFCFK